MKIIKTKRVSRFLSYYPLKQGLKLTTTILTSAESISFLSYYPLKQGLKRIALLPYYLHYANFYPTIH